MFQYAFGRGTALRMGFQLSLDTADFQWYSAHEGFQLPQLGIRYNQASEEDLRRLLGWQHQTWARRLRLYKHLPRPNTVVEPYFHFSPRCAKGPDGSYFVGYWQSYRYFSDFANDIRTDFTSGHVDLSAYGSLWHEIETSESVAVHVRRGDYVSTKRGRMAHGPRGSQYYDLAIAEICRLVPEPKFFVFSDQPSVVAEERLVKEPHVLVHVHPRPPAHVELRLMARCKHFVIANSSFSWWAAWLGSASNKRVIAPRKWFMDQKRTTLDLIPADWIGV